MFLVVVCGFEAFINGKHIVGEVKEKEQAHKEYREAISQGHGAYLMDEETPVCHVVPCLSLNHLVLLFVFGRKTSKAWIHDRFSSAHTRVTQRFPFAYKPAHGKSHT